MLSPSRQVLALASTTLFPAISGAIVINEIHFNPPDNVVRQEFIELYNPGPDEVGLTGWRLSGAVTYPFPSGTSIPAGGYLVVAEDPPTIQSTFQIASIGPYTGRLDSEGETVRLRNADDTVIDEADYKVGFPWPVTANGNGPSIELINPALDNSLGSSWQSSAPDPTPGAQNSVFANDAAPAIRKVQHTPNQPADSGDVLITALITDPDGVASVSLEVQVVPPGAYIPSHLPNPIVSGNIANLEDRPVNPSYETRWTESPMFDDGTNGDLVAGDNIFSATITAKTHRSLVRYRITVEDVRGLSARVPYPDDASLNFAYFVYNGIPDYEGIPAATLTSAPVYHLITRDVDYSECLAYDGADQIRQGTNARFFYNWSGTLVYDGEVYDNIRYRLRGANGRYYAQGKRSMRFRFNDGYYFQACDQLGNKYPEKWRTLTTGKGFDNRLTQTFALNEAVSMYLFNKVGVPASNTHWVHWRVIDDRQEAPDQWRGDFHGLNFVLETYDVRFLEAHDLEKGNLYKLINQTKNWQRQQRYQAAFGATNGADINNIEGQLDGNKSADYITAHVNVDRWNRSHALVEAIRHYDYWPNANKNMVYYFEPVYTAENGNLGRLSILPWDTDATWGPTWNEGHDVVYNSLFSSGERGGDSGTTPELWASYFNAVRELRDLLWQPDQIRPLIDEFASFIDPLETADALRWKGAPSDAGNYDGIGGAGATSLANLVQDMKNFAFVGGSWPGGGVGSGGRAAHLDSLQASLGEGGQIPQTPVISYIGHEDFPTNGLSFRSSNFSDPQGAGSFGAMEWRIAEITDSSAPAYDPSERFKLEWEADWESGVLNVFDNTLHLPTTAVRSGRTYRTRVRHQDDTGRWSHWSSAIEFTATLPDITQLLQGLVISEIMYHPTDPTEAEFAAGFTNDDDFEYIELYNAGPETLDLTDVRLTKGVDFDFLGSAITELEPGAVVLIVSDSTAMEMRYGPGLPIAGEWEDDDKIDNGGERIKLSFGAGDPIRDFSYGDDPPWPTAPDGEGVSLHLIAPDTVPDHSIPSNWRASSTPQGTPGTREADDPFQIWLATQGSTDPLSPFGATSLSHLSAFALGADLTSTPEASLPVVTILELEGLLYPAIRYRLRDGVAEVSALVELSDDLVTWQSGPAFIVDVGIPESNGDGTVTTTSRTLQPISAATRRFLRLRIDYTP